MENCALFPETACARFEEDERVLYKDSTFDVVSKVAYLIGVPKYIFENEHEPPKIEIFESLDKDRNARIIRNLCVIRAAIERKFGRINDKLRFGYATILNMPDLIPQDAIRQLELDGVNFYKKSSTKLGHHIIEINKLIRDRINNCKNIFPVWLNWDYIRDIFNMKNGLTEDGIKAAASVYFTNLECYPYSIYINWDPQPNGNILHNDKKFVTLLYRWNNDYFADYSKVSDANSFVKGSIYDFIDDADKVVMVVDCENSDPYRLCATLRGLSKDVVGKIQKIMLIDDVNTVDAWRVLEAYTNIPVEHIMTERVKKAKSLVDIELTAMTCREHFRNLVDNFIIVSSDSDYWGLISALPSANFLVMVERSKCGPDMKSALAGKGIFYCYIDDFYTGEGEELKNGVLFNELTRVLNESVSINVHDMLESVLFNARIEMSEDARRRFFERYIKPMKLVIDEKGNVAIELNKK